MTKLVYRAPEAVLDREAMDAIARDDIERLVTLPIDLGYHHENWRFIQDVCVRLSSHRDWRVRANSLQGLSLTARFRRRLEKNVVKPVLLRALKDERPEVVSTAVDEIRAINRLLDWCIGGAKKQKEIEARFERRKKANQPPEPTRPFGPSGSS
ncbi:MAG TPA: hypothetical protein VG734_15090 [Lacunisphaera sp.]|nr:hypothetical protein [Lacunisphaera sp.]